jgi:ssDNA-specific exonuclease RecJ
MPTAMVALEVFNELEFISVSNGREYKVTVNREAQRRTLEESRYYINLLKCVNRNKV